MLIAKKERGADQSEHLEMILLSLKVRKTEHVTIVIKMNDFSSPAAYAVKKLQPTHNQNFIDALDKLEEFGMGGKQILLFGQSQNLHDQEIE